MKLEDCTEGREVVIGVRYWALGFGLTRATVIETRPAPDRPEGNPGYPFGMVRVRLADPSLWSCAEPWIGPEDLAQPLGVPAPGESNPESC